MNELIFNDYMKIKKAELNGLMISFLSKILNIEDAGVNWNQEKVTGFVDVGDELLKKINAEYCNPCFYDIDTEKVPCYKTDKCKYQTCPFKK